MNIVSFFGSPRVNGNTDLLLREAERAVREAGLEVERFNLNSMTIRACQDCGGCNESGECIIGDDMETVYKALRKADRIILASPIFFFTVSAQAKLMIDRCQNFWCEKYLLKRPLNEGRHGRKGLLLLVGGMKKKIGADCAEACARAFFRTISVPEHESLSFLEVDSKGEILRHPGALAEAYQAGQRLAQP